MGPSLAQEFADRGWGHLTASKKPPRPPVRRGRELFTDGPYPRSWRQFVGQREAVAQLQAAAASARQRDEPMGHVLLASGLHGVGKSALARLVAWELQAGMTSLSNVVKVEQARAALRALRDRDVLFIDEIHETARTGGWLLHLLQDGFLRTGNGEERMPQVTVIGATTDAQALPETILSRFQIRPELTGYTDEEALNIAMHTAADVLGATGSFSRAQLRQVTKAANNMPRAIRSLLESVRDTAYVEGGTGLYNVRLALRWRGLTEDGLDRSAQRYLLALLEHQRLSEQALVALLSEPGGLRHTEKLLLGRGFISIERDGRRLTAAGGDRARELEAGDA